MAQRKGRLGLLERLMFSVMGPPELGDPQAPVPDAPARPVELCRTCRRPYGDHEVVRDPGLTYTRCPQA